MKDEVKTKDDEVILLKEHIISICPSNSDGASKEELKKRLYDLLNEYQDIYTTRLLNEDRKVVQPCLDELDLKIKETVRQIDKITTHKGAVLWTQSIC